MVLSPLQLSDFFSGSLLEKVQDTWHESNLFPSKILNPKFSSKLTLKMSKMTTIKKLIINFQRAQYFISNAFFGPGSNVAKRNPNFPKIGFYLPEKKCLKSLLGRVWLRSLVKVSELSYQYFPRFVSQNRPILGQCCL